MISEVKEFLDKFIQAEMEAWIENENPDLIFRNQLVDKVNSFCDKIMVNKMGIGVWKYPMAEPGEYEQSKNFEYFPRNLYKISQYQNEKFGEVYLAYVSASNPDPKNLKIFECIFIANIDNELKIIGDYFVSNKDNTDIMEWNKSRALDDLSFKTAGKFITVERFMEPVGNEWSMEEYLKDK
jgi:hypothetical protein